jgi:hypothetical protein
MQRNPILTRSEPDFCAQRQDLVDEFVEASRGVIELNATPGVIEGDPDFARFDDLLHVAREKKNEAKDALIAHLQEHHC